LRKEQNLFITPMVLEEFLEKKIWQNNISS
jgi:hypothetical protein